MADSSNNEDESQSGSNSNSSSGSSSGSSSNSSSSSNSNSSSSSNSNSNSNNTNSDSDSTPPPVRRRVVRRKPVVSDSESENGSGIQEFKKFFPHVVKQPTTIEEWIEARRVFPNDFTYSSSGDLVAAKVLPSEQEKIIIVPEFEPATDEYIQEFEKTKRAEIVAPEDEFVLKKREFKENMLKYKRGEITADTILTLNQQLREYEVAYNEKVKYPRAWDVDHGVMERMLTFGHYDTRSFVEPVFIASYTTFPTRQFWMPKRKEEAPLEQSPQTAYEASNSNSNSNSNSENSSQEGGSKRVYTDQQRAIIGKAMSARAGRF
jgi:hypothetical protein